METKVEPLLVQVVTDKSMAEVERDIRSYTDEALRTVEPGNLHKEISLRFSTTTSPSYNLAIGLAFETERAREAYERLVLPWLDRKYKIEVVTEPVTTAASSYGNGDGHHDQIEPFSSLDELISFHTGLLASETEPDTDKLKDFIRRGARTGIRLDNTDERRTAQSLLNYWVTVLYRVQRDDIPNAVLAFYVPPAHLGLEKQPCPYIGLSPYREEDQDSFFGRDLLTSAVVERILEKRFVVLVGPSGSGKTSVLNAGVLPKLKNSKDLESYKWRYFPAFTPGSDPLKNLARVFTDDAEPLVQKLSQQPNHLVELMKDPESETAGVLVIDQFEELFTTCKDDQARDKFITALLSLKESSAHRVILLMRSDQVNQFIRRPALNQVFRETEVRVYPLRENELHDVIKKPAEKIGLKFESGVIEQLMREIFGDPVGLPLLQFALLELWADRECDKITWGAMNRLGTCRDALVKKAEQFYAGLAEDEKRVTRHILLRMVRLSDTWEAATEPVRLVDLYEQGQDRERVNGILLKLLAANLARISNLHCRPASVTGEAIPSNLPAEISENYQFELAHQSLARYWPKITEWFNELRESLVIKRRLELYASNWAILGHGDKGLLDKYQLYEAEKWLASDGAKELGYDRDVQALTQRSRKAINYDRRFRALTYAGLVTVILVVIVLLMWSEHQRLKQATSSRLALTADTLKDQDLDLALLLNLEALSRNRDDLAVRNSLMRAATYSPVLSAFLDTKGNAVKEICFGKDGKNLFALDESRRSIRSWNLASRKPDLEMEIPYSRKSQHADNAPEQFPLLSPDGSYLLFIDADGRLVGRKTQSTEPPQTIYAPEVKIESRVPLAFSHDSSRLAWVKDVDGEKKPGTSEKSAVTVQDLKDQNKTFSSDVSRLSAIAFTPDNKTLAGVTPGGDILLFRVENDRLRPIGKPLASGLMETPQSLRMAFSGDSQRLAFLYPNKELRVWNLKDHALQARFSRASRESTPGTKPQKAHSEDDYKAVSYFSLDKTGSHLVAGYNDGSVVFWDVNDDSKPPREHPNQHSAPVTEAVFSPENKMLITFSNEEFPTLWVRTETPPNAARFDLRGKLITGHNQKIVKVAFAPNEELIAAAGDNGMVALWNLEEQLPSSKLTGTGDPKRVTRDGRLFALGNKDEIKIFDLNTSKEISKLSVKLDWLTAENNIRDFFLDREGNVLVVSYYGNTIGIWDLRTREFKGSISTAGKSEYGLPIHGMALDSAGKLLAVASDDGRTLLWNLGTMKSTPIEHGGIGSVTIALSADGTRLASSDSNGVVRIWNTSTGQKMRDDIPSGPQSFQLEFAEDGARLLVNRNKNLSLWDTKQGEKPLWKANDIEGITLSSVKKEIAATTSDGSIVFLSLADGKEQFRLPASEVEKLGKSEKSGDQLSSSEIEKLGARTASIYSPDGNRLILGYSDGSIRSIKLDLDTWTRRACAIANREISPSEKIAHQLFADRVWSFFNPRSYLWPEPPICG